jgi:hypothetical protein
MGLGDFTPPAPVTYQDFSNQLQSAADLSKAAYVPPPTYPDFLAAANKAAGVGNPVNLQQFPTSVTGHVVFLLNGRVVPQGTPGALGHFVPGTPGIGSGIGVTGGRPGMPGGGTAGRGWASNAPWQHGAAGTFWDTGHSGNGDTGAPASGVPMQFAMVASEFYPMGTRMNIRVGNRIVQAFVGDFGPGRSVPGGGSAGSRSNFDVSDPMAAYLRGGSPGSFTNNDLGGFEYQVVGRSAAPSNTMSWNPWVPIAYKMWSM